MTMTIDEIDAEIAMWKRRHELWLPRHGEIAVRGSQTCLDEIEKRRRQRKLTEQTERK